MMRLGHTIILLVLFFTGSILTMCTPKISEMSNQEPEHRSIITQSNVTTEDDQEPKRVISYSNQDTLAARAMPPPLTEDELARKITDALKGDYLAAYKIARHFFHGLDVQKMTEWHIITVENIHKALEWQLITEENFPVDGFRKLCADSLLLNANNEFCTTRGIFWLYGLAKNGYKTNHSNAEDYLNEKGYTLETAKPPDDILFPFDYENLSEAEIAICKKGALQGNIKASMYYEEITEDNELAVYWYRICVQNGSKECQYKLGQILSQKDDPLSQIRGQLWLDEARSLYH